MQFLVVKIFCLKLRCRYRKDQLLSLHLSSLFKKLYTINSLRNTIHIILPHSAIQLAKGQKRYWQIVRIDWWSHASVDLLASHSVHGASTNLRAPLVGDSDRGCFLEQWKHGRKRRSQCNDARSVNYLTANLWPLSMLLLPNAITYM